LRAAGTGAWNGQILTWNEWRAYGHDANAQSYPVRVFWSPHQGWRVASLLKLHSPQGADPASMKPTDRERSANGEIRTDDTCLVFLHIPKTAGQTLSTFLIRNYPREQIVHLDILGFPSVLNPRPFDEYMERVPLEKRSTARVIWGHLPYGVHRHIPRSCDYITVLREPTDRVISGYKYIRKESRHVLHDRVVNGDIGLEEYIESGMDKVFAENLQTLQLSGRQFGTLDDEALREAKRNMEQFLLVGLTERFEETLALLRRTLRLRVPVYVSRNVSTPLKVSESATKLIRERNALDMELYEFARDLFVERVASQGRFFAFQVTAFRALRPMSRLAGGRAKELRRKLSRLRRHASETGTNRPHRT
jgi:hypothetical protein